MVKGLNISVKQNSEAMKKRVQINLRKLTRCSSFLLRTGGCSCNTESASTFRVHWTTSSTPSMGLPSTLSPFCSRVWRARSRLSDQEIWAASTISCAWNLSTHPIKDSCSIDVERNWAISATATASKRARVRRISCSVSVNHSLILRSLITTGFVKTTCHKINKKKLYMKITFYCHPRIHEYVSWLNIKFSPPWSCVSLTQSTTSSEWKLQRPNAMCF